LNSETSIKSVALNSNSYQGSLTLIGVWVPGFSMYGYEHGYIYSDDMLYRIRAEGKIPPGLPENCQGYGYYRFYGTLRENTFYINYYTLISCVPFSQ
jgi:hypothetical protein